MLLFQYPTSVVHSRVTITGRVDYGIAVIEPHGDLIHSQGVCFYAAMDINYSTVMPLSTSLVINNVSLVDDTYDSSNGAICLAILTQSEYYIKIRLNDIHIEIYKVNIVYYDVCKTDASCSTLLSLMFTIA